MGHVSQYFNQKRGLANGIGTAAASVGTLVAAPLVTYLLEEYSLRGTLLITGGISTHLFIAAMLLRPTEFYKPRWVRSEGAYNAAFENTENSSNNISIEDLGRQVMSQPSTNSQDPPLESEEKTVCCIQSSNSGFLRKWTFYVHVLVMGFVFLGFNNINIILIPTRAKEMGFSPYEASSLISIFAGFDGMGRIFFGWLIDQKLLPRGLLFGCDLILFGTLMILYTLAGRSYVISAVMLAAIGFVMGMIHPANVTLLVERVGIKVIQRALAAMLLILAIPIMFFLQIPGESVK